MLSRGCLDIHGPLFILIDRRLGGAQPGNRFVSFVRAYARSGCLVELNLKFCWLLFSLFPFCPGELSLFPFGLGSFPFPLLVLGAFPFPFPPPPNILSNFSWAYRCVRSRVNTAGSVRMQYIVHQTGNMMSCLFMYPCLLKKNIL